MRHDSSPCFFIWCLKAIGTDKVPLYLSPWLVHQFNPRKPFPMISLEFTMAINEPG